MLSNHPQQSPRSPPCTRQSSWSSRPRARPRLCHGTGDRLTGSAGSEVARGGQRKEVSHVILQDHCILHDLHFTVATFSLYFLRERASEREQTQVLELSKSRTPLRRVGRVSHVDGGQSKDLTVGPKRRNDRRPAGWGAEGRGGGKKTHSSTPTVFLPSQNGQLKVVGTFFCFFFSGGGAEDFRFPMAVPWRPPSQSRLPNSPGWLRSARFGFPTFFFSEGKRTS